MVEVLEYALVVLVSSMVVGYSIQVYGRYASELGRSAEEARFASVVSLANSAIEHGASTATLELDGEGISCASDVLKFQSRAFSGSSTLPADCEIPEQHLSGSSSLHFDFSAGVLSLQVR